MNSDDQKYEKWETADRWERRAETLRERVWKARSAAQFATSRGKNTLANMYRQEAARLEEEARLALSQSDTYDAPALASR